MQLTVRDALNSAMDEEMDRDKDVFILGEEVNRDGLRDALHQCACWQGPHQIGAARLQSLTPFISHRAAGGRVPGGVQGETKLTD